MNFIFGYSKSIGKSLFEDAETIEIDSTFSISIEKDRYKKIVSNRNGTILLIGDCINDYILRSREGVFKKDIVNELKGVFYLIHIRNSEITFFSSPFALLPIYYNRENLVVSNSINNILHVYPEINNINRRFILESYLFNYPLSNTTFIKNILLLESFNFLQVKNGSINIQPFANVWEWFVEKADMVIQKSEFLADKFIKNIESYFVNDKNLITLTGGFDGRTILSSALFHSKEVETFSMGKPENLDVSIPGKLSNKYKFPYKYYHLGNDDYTEEYYSLSARISEYTYGFNGFLYPYFLFGIRKEAEKHQLVHTGYCGSELFRALHITGAVTSYELTAIFIEKDTNILKSILWNSERLSFIKKEHFKDEFDEMFFEITSIREKKQKGFSINQTFYHFVFTEVFRKMFGSIVTFQFSEMSVRVPYLDLNFIKELLKTDLAGCNNDFYTDNPLKRFKGQLLYSKIIKKTHDGLYKSKTGKGYSPKDLNTVLGLFKIGISYSRKILKNKLASKKKLDNLGLITGYIKHREKINLLFEGMKDFEVEKILNASNSLDCYTKEVKRDQLFMTASIAQILKSL